MVTWGCGGEGGVLKRTADRVGARTLTGDARGGRR